MSGSTARPVTLTVLVNGKKLQYAETADVTTNGYFQADHFRAEISLADPVFNAAWWADQSDLQVEIQVGIGNTTTSLIIGNTDSIGLDIAGGCVTVAGRDLSSLLIDLKIQDAYANQTSSQIAQALAAQTGKLTADVTPTSTPVGQYYQLEHDRISQNNFTRQTTAWDLLTQLAKFENYDLYVQGTVLNFHPAQDTPNTPAFTVVYQPGPPQTANVESFTLDRDLTLAKDIQVSVKTWNAKQKHSFVKTVRGSAGKGGNPTVYTFTKPGLTPDQALQYAQTQLAILSKHERKLRFSMPGEVILDPRKTVALKGTGTAFDITYYIAEINRHISFHNGMTETVSCKNTSPRQIAEVTEGS